MKYKMPLHVNPLAAGDDLESLPILIPSNQPTTPLKQTYLDLVAPGVRQQSLPTIKVPSAYVTLLEILLMERNDPSILRTRILLITFSTVSPNVNVGPSKAEPLLQLSIQ